MGKAADYFLGERYRGLGLLPRLPQPTRDEAAAAIEACRRRDDHPESSPADFSQELLMGFDDDARAGYLDGRIKFPFYNRVGGDGFWRCQRSQTPYLDRLAEFLPHLDMGLLEQLWIERGRGMPGALPTPNEGKGGWRSVDGLAPRPAPDAPPWSYSGPYAAAIVAPRCGIGGAEKVTREMAAAIQRLTGLPCLIVIADRQVDPAALPPGAICLPNTTLGGEPFLRQPREVRVEALRDLLALMGVPRVISINSSLGNALLLDHAPRAEAIAAASALFFVSVGAGGASEGRIHVADWLIDAGVTLFTDNDAIAERLARQSFYDQAVVLALPEAVGDAPAPSGTNVLWAGRLDAQKRPDLLLEIARASPHLIYEAWGTPVLSDGAMVDAFAAQPNIVYRGAFEGFAAIDTTTVGALLYTSAYDGAPNLLIEAMARGLPCVASAVGGIPALMAHGRGVLVAALAPAADYVAALDRLLGDATARQALSRAGRDYVARAHTTQAFDRTVARLLETMQSAADG